MLLYPFFLLVSDLWLMGRDCFPYSLIRLPTSLCLSNCPEREKSTQLKFIAYILPPAPLCLILRFNSLFSLNRGLLPQRLAHTQQIVGFWFWPLVCASGKHTHTHTHIHIHTNTHPLSSSISQAIQTHPVTAVGSIVSICAVLRWTLTGLHLFTATCEGQTQHREPVI